MDNAKKGLLSGTFVYLIGNAAVALLQLIMLRFITGNVNSEGYGYYDTIVKIDNLITPMLTLQISDAVFRFVLKGDNKDKIKAITNGSFIIIIGIILTEFGVAIIGKFFIAFPHSFLVALYIISTNIFSFYQKLARAVGANLSYVKSNLIKAFLYLVLQVVLIYYFKLKVESLFIATILSTTFCLFYLEWKIKARKRIDIKAINLSYLKKMLIYSIPLVPNTMLWWFSSSVNSLYISTKIGLDSNGIYSVAGKFSSIIVMVTSVFNLAWQESAIKEYGSDSGKTFYNEVYKMFYRLICCAVIVCIPIMQLFLPHMIDVSYYDAIRYAPILVIGAGLSSTYGFFGQMYGAIGKTKGAAITTFYGVFTNLLIILIFTKYIGLWAPTLAVVCSSFVIMIMRYNQFKDEMKLSITKELLFLVLLIVLIIPIYYLNNSILSIFVLLFGVGISLYINKSLINDIKTIIKNKLNNVS
ncbi:polysaccharide biosynthesis C-terminal domain-containing protein [Eubacterium sp.]|uniref:lipopolysaccharide biosynthesis protein n=1 Tax=Eubacterium sp. TaxID=142586 RepID=UPI0025D6BD6D|nr:polysaccharide biosynthesis C-terminal domain-containing protein [Eubacterium sp.]MCR5629813.1 polysaccharide biosynthesis C-terminal domain-containing protein [Eubacterium sp.]